MLDILFIGRKSNVLHKVDINTYVLLIELICWK